jgi:acyl phosphate:glycerol-3-phosphate acyltransferase
MDAAEAAVAVVVIVAAYLIGGIPWGVVYAKVTGGTDPRTIGSGRTGGANVLRALGPRAALASGLLDVLKGVSAVVIAIVVGAGLGVQVLAALAAILGHSRSVFINFAGGRGIAPGWGGLLVLQPIAALLVVPVFVVVLLVGRYSSLASLTATTVGALTAVATVLLFGLSPLYAIYAVAAAALIWLFHRDNVERLLAGSERRIEFRRP